MLQRVPTVSSSGCPSIVPVQTEWLSPTAANSATPAWYYTTNLSVESGHAQGDVQMMKLNRPRADPMGRRSVVNTVPGVVPRSTSVGTAIVALCRGGDPVLTVVASTVGRQTGAVAPPQVFQGFRRRHRPLGRGLRVDGDRSHIPVLPIDLVLEFLRRADPLAAVPACHSLMLPERLGHH